MQLKSITAYGLLAMFSLILIFHLLIISGMIPYDIVWGGRLQSPEQMIQFELVSIAINTLFWLLAASNVKFLIPKGPNWLMKTGFVVMAILFTLNTVGNLLSQNEFEKWFFTPQTLLLAFCAIVQLLPARQPVS